MRTDQRIVTKMPVTELWDDVGSLSGGRLRDLTGEELTELLRVGSVTFVVADCGLNLLWIPVEERFQFWKTVKPQIADHYKPMHRNKFPNEIAYIASEWRGRSGECIVLLEKHH